MTFFLGLEARSEERVLLGLAHALLARVERTTDDRVERTMERAMVWTDVPTYELEFNIVEISALLCWRRPVRAAEELLVRSTAAMAI